MTNGNGFTLPIIPTLVLWDGANKMGFVTALERAMAGTYATETILDPINVNAPAVITTAIGLGLAAVGKMAVGNCRIFKFGDFKINAL